jgi:peptidoglycan/xylan/chitin deacetylase (PgdA/CDA1 family)
LEQRVSSDFDVPRGGFPPARLHESGDPGSNLVAITFDDGPHPEQTPRLLDSLGERGVRATFYVIGMNAREHPDIVRRAFDEGHEIGSHTWSHRFLTTQTTRSIIEELRSTDEAIEEITSTRPVTLRPPYGAVTPRLAAWTAHEFRYETVLWSVDSKDYEDLSSDEITRRIRDHATGGSIILTHDPLANTVAAMPAVLDQLVDRGFEFATSNELISPS